MDWIKQLISKLTFPKAAEMDECGDWWIPIDLYEIPRHLWHDGINPHHEFAYNYRAIKQTKWGRWVKGSTYLGRNYSMEFYRNLSTR